MNWGAELYFAGFLASIFDESEFKASVALSSSKSWQHRIGERPDLRGSDRVSRPWLLYKIEIKSTYFIEIFASVK
jgi:hypothetical protein